MESDQTRKAFHITRAIPVVPSDDVDMKYPGVIFIDESGTEGVATVDLLEGGTIILPLKKGGVVPYYVVKRVYLHSLTAAGIFVNPINQVK